MADEKEVSVEEVGNIVTKIVLFTGVLILVALAFMTWYGSNQHAGIVANQEVINQNIRTIIDNQDMINKNIQIVVDNQAVLQGDMITVCGGKDVVSG